MKTERKAFIPPEFLCAITLLSSLASIARTPEHDRNCPQAQQDPFSLLSSTIKSRHQKMMSKLQKLYLQPNKSLNGTCLLYISLLLVTMSNDIEFNPGSRAPKYPCGSCGAAVRINQNSIQCDYCNAWHHIDCQVMGLEIHQVMVEHESYTWVCTKCGLPNFSTTFFETSLSSFNSFSELDVSQCPLASTPCKNTQAKTQKA